jgi:hypothetical protein
MSGLQAVINGVRRVEERIAEDNKESAKFSFTPNTYKSRREQWLMQERGNFLNGIGVILCILFFPWVVISPA